MANRLILNRLRDACTVLFLLAFAGFTHVSRHTFATTITLNNGVPLESVSKLLGHRSIKTTEIYAKILDTKVGQDMEALARKIN